jgi:hypothetical protein
MKSAHPVKTLRSFRFRSAPAPDAAEEWPLCAISRLSHLRWLRRTAAPTGSKARRIVRPSVPLPLRMSCAVPILIHAPLRPPRYRRYAVIHLSQLFVGLHRAQRPARVRIGRPAAAVSQFIDDRVAQHANLRDLNLDHVARLHEQRRRTLDADTAPRSGNDDLPWQQGNSRPRTEALTHPVRLRAGTTALRRFVQ